MELHPAYPTCEHKAAAGIIVDHFSHQPATEAILLVGSTARGKAVPGSCVDIAVLVRPEVTIDQRAAMERDWNEIYTAEPAFALMRRHGPFAHVDLDIVDGRFEPGYHGWTSGPDDFELEIGNTLAYSYPLWQRGDYFEVLKGRWLPYYAEALRSERLGMVTRFCRNNLEHIPMYVERALYFQAFDRLYNAFGEFLQALFIARRTYPIAYDKWIREQIVEILKLPELYPSLPALFEIRHFESAEIAEKGQMMERHLEQYVESS